MGSIIKFESNSIETKVFDKQLIKNKKQRYKKMTFRRLHAIETFTRTFTVI